MWSLYHTWRNWDLESNSFQNFSAKNPFVQRKYNLNTEIYKTDKAHQNHCCKLEVSSLLIPSRHLGQKQRHPAVGNIIWKQWPLEIADRSVLTLKATATESKQQVWYSWLNIVQTNIPQYRKMQSHNLVFPHVTAEWKWCHCHRSKSWKWN